MWWHESLDVFQLSSIDFSFTIVIHSVTHFPTSGERMTRKKLWHVIQQRTPRLVSFLFPLCHFGHLNFQWKPSYHQKWPHFMGIMRLFEKSPYSARNEIKMMTWQLGKPGKFRSAEENPSISSLPVRYHRENSCETERCHLFPGKLYWKQERRIWDRPSRRWETNFR